MDNKTLKCLECGGPSINRRPKFVEGPNGVARPPKMRCHYLGKNPRVFFCAEKNRKPRVVIEIEGGNIQGAWTDGAVEVLVYDFDNIKEGGCENYRYPAEPSESISVKDLDNVIKNLDARVKKHTQEAAQ